MGSMATIRMNEFGREPAELMEREVAACRSVISSGWYILGSCVERFEAQWAAYCGSRYSVGVGNGMDAIEIALRAFSVQRGDEVITTSVTAYATVLAILRAGAVPVVADVDEATGNVDPVSIERCLSKKTKAVLPVHLYGRVADMDRICGICRREGITLIEDCAQAHGATLNGRPAGTFGAAAAFSFYPTKNLGAIGDAGAVVTDSEEVAQKCKRLRNYGQSVRYEHPELGLNSRLDEIHAAMLTERLKSLDEFVRTRRQIALVYYSKVRNERLKLVGSAEDCNEASFHLFVLCVEERARFMEYMRENGVDTLIHYPLPIHFQKPTLDVLRDPQGLPNAESFARHCVSIPCHPQMHREEVEFVADLLNKYN